MNKELNIIQVKVSEIIPYDLNAKKHDQVQINNVAESIKQFGFRQPIVLDKDNVIIIGHCRWLASKKLKLDTVPCHYAEDLTEEQVVKLRNLDNKLNESEWDFDLLKDQVINIDFQGFEIDWGIPDIETQPQEIVEDIPPEADEENEPRTKLGDIWQLGEHRLMCGDSTDKTTVERLMDGNKADIAFTSPPYNAGTTVTETAMGKTTKYNGNDDNKSKDEYIDFLNSYIQRAIENSEYVFVNVQSISNNKIALIDVLHHNKDIYADTIIWDKIHGQPAMAENVMNSVFEYVHIFSKKANRVIGTINFRGTVDNILHLQPQRKNEYSDIHNATFSVEFASHFIKNFAKESVLDQFGGTGTTLIACEQLNRKCYMMELDPKYCDVIIKRWENLTNKKAIKL